MRTKFLSHLSAAFGLIAGTLVIGAAALPASPVSAARPTKYEVCHRTNAIKNPYRRITVAWSSVNDDQNGHDNDPSHEGIVFDITDPATTHGTNASNRVKNPGAGQKNQWGDIFYAVKNAGQKNSNNWFVDANNNFEWDSNTETTPLATGQAIFNGATFTYAGVTKQACKKMTIKEFVASEIEGGRTATQVMTDLDDQGASEDKSTLDAVGGSFSNWHTNLCTSSPSTCDDPDAINTALNAVSPVAVTDPEVVSGSSATIKGKVNPRTQVSDIGFYYSSDCTKIESLDTVLTATEVITNTAQNASSDVTINHNLTNLADGTYCYRAFGVTESGSGDTAVASYYWGAVETFSIGSVSTSTSSTVAASGSSSDSTTSSTAASTATTAAPATTVAGGTSSAKGKVVGKVWLEIKKDAKHATNEPLLSGLSVTLKSGTTTVGTKTTGASGDFEFTDLAPGTYVATVSLGADSPFARSSDSDGSGDWVVSVTVTAGGTATAEYAAIGTAKAGGTAVKSSGGSTKIIPFASVVCTWAGPDGEIGTDDDADFSTKTGADGTYLIKNIPTGEYSCVAEDSASGESTSTDSVKVTALSAKKSDAAVKTAVLKIAGNSLPATGRESGRLAWLALGTLLFGLGLFGLKRRLTD